MLATIVAADDKSSRFGQRIYESQATLRAKNAADKGPIVPEAGLSFRARLDVIAACLVVYEGSAAPIPREVLDWARASLGLRERFGADR